MHFHPLYTLLSYTFIHSHKLSYTFIHFHTLHFHTLSYTFIHSHTLSYTFIHSTLPYTFIHFHALYTSIHFHTLSYTSIHFHTLSYTFIHFHTLSYTLFLRPNSGVTPDFKDLLKTFCGVRSTSRARKIQSTLSTFEEATSCLSLNIKDPVERGEDDC